jgi:hypothetical protein
VLAFVAAMTNVWLTMSKAVAVATESSKAASNKTMPNATGAPEDRVTDEIDGKST